MKKNRQNLLLLFSMWISLMALFACEEDAETVSKIPLDGISVSGVKSSMKVNEKVTLSATLSPEGLTEKVVPLWLSSNPRVASVTPNETGMTANVNAISPGDVTISVSNADGIITAASELTVSHVIVESLVLSTSNLSMTIGDVTELSVTVGPDNITESFVPVWTSSDPNVISISTDESGLVATLTSIGIGSITVKASNSDGSVSASATVGVDGIALESVSLVLSSETANEKVYNVVFSPANASNQNVTWASSNVDAATVVNGTVSKIGSGSATITVTSEEGSYTDMADVHVNIDNEFDDYCGVNGTAADYYPATVVSSGASTNLNYSGVLPTDYYDYHTVEKITITQGGSFDLDITQGSQWALTLAYIDWNGDGIWDVASDEPGILFGTVNAGTAAPGSTLSNTINVPADAAIGTTRMRVTTVDAWTTDISTASLSCGVNGEIRNSSTVDFDIEIE